MATYFPSELPDRPQKQGFTKRWTQKLTLRTKKQKKPVVTSEPCVSDDAPKAARDGASKVWRASRNYIERTQVDTSASQPLPYGSPVHLNSNLPRQASYTAPSSERPRPTPLPLHIGRKQLPPSPFGGLLQDPLVQRFEKLRFAKSSTMRNMRAQPTAIPSDISSTQPMHDSNSATELALPTLRRQSPSLPGRHTAPPSRRESPILGSMADWPIVIDHERDGEVIADSGWPVRSLSPTNYFRSSSRGRSNQRYRSAPSDKRNQRRSRSPNSFSVSSSSSEGSSTPGSSDVSYPDLTTQVTLVEDSRREFPNPGTNLPLTYTESLAFQEEQDRQLAQWLQQEENNTHAEPQFLLDTDSGRIHAPPYASRKRGLLSDLRRAPKPQGTRENPIDLDAESYDWVDAFYGERMEIDENSLALHDTSLAQSSNQNLQQEMEVARSIQAEEYSTRNKSPGNRECVVCGENSLIVDLPSLANCTHRPETCTDCFAAWIATQLRDSGWTEVKCPGDRCTVMLVYFEIQQYATQEIFQQYDNFIARAAFSEDPNFRWCRNCNSGQIHLTGVEGPIFTCINCEHKVCVVHENTWHEGETCEEYEYRASGQKERDQKAQEKASLKAIGKLSKKCPGPNCQYSIEKNDGCDHMTCTRCRYEFCWICLCDYNAVRREGNSAHSTTCKYHTERLA